MVIGWLSTQFMRFMTNDFYLVAMITLSLKERNVLNDNASNSNEAVWL